MKDRIPTPGQEGRMLITPENGDPPFYATVAMADNPLDEGTPLNTATLLKQQTAAMFGLDENAVPDDALAWLGKYNQHWWARIAQENKTVYIEASAPQNIEHYMKFVFANVYYSDSYTVDPNTGVVALVSPKVVQKREDLYNRYVKGVNGGITFYDKDANPTAYDTDVFYVKKLSDGHDGTDGSTMITFGSSHVAFTKIYSIATVVNTGGLNYVRSSDRNAYPDSGISNGFEWRYLGVPFDNAVTAPKIVTGSYVGTGKYGANTPNTFTFNGKPKYIIVGPHTLTGNQYKYSYGTMAIINVGWLSNEYRQFELVGTYNTTGNYPYIKWDDETNTMTWYSVGHAGYQMNELNSEYAFVIVY